MKLLLFLAVMMLPGVNASAQTSNSLRGDANGDGVVNAADIVEIVNIILTGGNMAPAGVEAVDLGLPSGTLWANMNLGASKPEDYGDFFAWGEKTPQSNNQYSWASYKWCNGSEKTLTKYCINSSYGYNGFRDNLTELLPEDDAATVNWGGVWYMPTLEQFYELIDNTTSEMTTQNGVYGRKFTSTTNGNSIFFPTAGYCRDDNCGGVDAGWYWSSTLNGSTFKAWFLFFKSGDMSMHGSTNTERYNGYSVRPVLKN